MSAPTSTSLPPDAMAASHRPRRFTFERDTIAFANELLWEYRFDDATGRTTTIERDPKPDYTLRCFVLTAAVRQFFFHATFDASQPRLADSEYRALIRRVLRRSPRHAAPPDARIPFAGFDGLRAFSTAYEVLLKDECGGAWRSYVLRSHWRMVFPISRRNQAATAKHLRQTLDRDGTAVVHLVRFPQLTINHGVVLFDHRTTGEGIEFDVYDPNQPGQPTLLSYHAARRTFQFPANAYWIGGRLDVIEIYRNWFL